MPDHSIPPYHSAEGYRCDLPLEQVAEALRHNGFETYVVPDASRAKELFFEIVAREQPASISWGGSMTLEEAGILPENVEVTDLCTCCNPRLLFSHRASHGKRGNLGAFLMLKEKAY